MKGRKIRNFSTHNKRYYAVKKIDLTISNENFITDGKVTKENQKIKISGGKETVLFTPDNTKNYIIKGDI